MAVLVALGWASSWDLTAYGQSPQPVPTAPILPSRLPVAAAGDLMAFSAEMPNGRSQVIVIDAAKRVMTVYHVDRESGGIELMGVRNFHWDLLIEEFNGQAPLPREIRHLLDQRQ